MNYMRTAELPNAGDYKILVGCETSSIVREAFNDLGFETWSCDLLPADTPTNQHIQDDIRRVLKMEQWDLATILHPPCTRLCNSGVRWLSTPPPGRTLQEMWDELDEGAELFSDCLNADVPHIAVENPVMHKYAKSRIRNYVDFAQSVQPWQFAEDIASDDNVKKRTCLWLKNLPNLVATGSLDASTARDDIHRASPGKDRWKIRSKFHRGLARAMAAQWGAFLLTQPARAITEQANLF